MSSPVVPQVGFLPVYETSIQKCARCPTRYLEVKRIGEEGYRLCCACWFELASDTIVYGLDVFQRHASEEAAAIEEELERIIRPTSAVDRGELESACYLRQVEENRRQRIP